MEDFDEVEPSDLGSFDFCFCLIFRVVRVFRGCNNFVVLTVTSCGGRNRTCGPVVQSHGFLPAETTPHREEGRAGLEPARGCLTGTCSAAELPTRIESALRELNPPVQGGSLMPLPIGQGHDVEAFSYQLSAISFGDPS